MVIDCRRFLLGNLFHPPLRHRHSDSGHFVTLLSVTECRVISPPPNIPSEIHSSHADLCLPIVEVWLHPYEKTKQNKTPLMRSLWVTVKCKLSGL